MVYDACGSLFAWWIMQINYQRKYASQVLKKKFNSSLKTNSMCKINYSNKHQNVAFTITKM
jgi:hypothetical protein